jgi:hypothetical protein
MLYPSLPPFIPTRLNLNASSQNQKDREIIPSTLLNWPINVPMCTFFGANVDISSRAKQFPWTHLNFLCGRK